IINKDFHKKFGCVTRYYLLVSTTYLPKILPFSIKS
ncbi:hypothetical protein AWRI1631_132240, partial [Saccharomyces cerevisiae AWRI1631]